MRERRVYRYEMAMIRGCEGLEREREEDSMCTTGIWLAGVAAVLLLHSVGAICLHFSRRLRPERAENFGSFVFPSYSSSLGEPELYQSRHLLGGSLGRPT